MRILITWLCLCLLWITGGCTSPPVTLALLGDIQLGRGVAQARAGGSWEEALSYLQPTLAGADLALANLESPLSESASVLPGWRLQPVRSGRERECPDSCRHRPFGPCQQPC